MSDIRPPKDDLVRSSSFELRSEGDSPPTLFGHFTPFNTWTKIDSAWEGTFLERVAPGAFSKTIAENRTEIKVLFQHGQDPQVGDKPLGKITELREEEVGPYYEVELLDAGYVKDIQAGLKAGLYGSSFRFRVMREEFDEKPKRSDYNDEGIPERTIKEARLFEFGPVTFPAYATATAGVRSLTDELFLERLQSRPDRLRDLLAFLPSAPSDDAGSSATSKERREDAIKRPRFVSRGDYLSWLTRQGSPS